MKNKHTDRILITDQDRRFVVKMSIYFYQKSLHIRFPFKYNARIFYSLYFWSQLVY